MKKLFKALIVCLIVTTAAFGQRGELVNGTVKSDILGVEKPYVVYLPVGYDSASNVKYPVLYLLHGAWGTCENWSEIGHARTIADQIIGSELAVPMIIVMPDARGKGENFGGKHMGYFNQSEWRYEDFFFHEFLPEIERRFNIDSQKKSRAISGLSMGGGGSAAYAQRHPELFGMCAPMSGLLDAFAGSRAMGLDSEFDKAIRETSPVAFVRNANAAQVEALKSIRWFVDCGDDDYLYEANIDLYREMRKKGIPLQFRMRDGAHDWVYWQTSLPEVMRFASIGFVK